MINKNAVAVVVIKDGYILLGLRPNGEGWCLPGGKVEGGENHLDAAHRELREEFGLRAMDLYEKGWGEAHTSPGYGDIIWQPMVFECLEFIGEIQLEPNKILDCNWFSTEEVSNLYHNGQMFPGSKAVFKGLYPDLIKI